MSKIFDVKLKELYNKSIYAWVVMRKLDWEGIIQKGHRHD